MEIIVRPARTIAELRACQETQRRAWGISEEGYLIPIATMVGVQHCGGLVLGAFLPDGRAAGLSFAFRGKWRGRQCLYSQLTGIDPDYQDLGIGTELKTAQREFAWSQGDIELIVWAFDPFQPGNANFNLNRLGATAVEYIEDMYGPRTDPLNAGMPTDRLIVEWELDATPRGKSDSAEPLAQIITTKQNEGTLVACGVKPGLSDGLLLLEVPARIADLRRRAPEVAAGWRTAVRQAFQTYLPLGYRAAGFVSREEAGGRRCFYLLEHKETE